MSREQLEAAIRKQLTRIVARTMQVGVSTAILNDAVDTILAAADVYGTTQYGGTADRRAALAADVYHGKPRHGAQRARQEAQLRGEL